MSKEDWQAGQEARELITPALLALLNAIQNPHAAKKRATVRKLAFALANNEPVKNVFDQPDTCAETIWYGKWQYDPAIKAAYDAYVSRVLEWRDQETARLEAYYRTVRLQKIAKYAAVAPDEIANVMGNSTERGQTRLDAALLMLKLADPAAADGAQLNRGATIENNITNGLTDADLIAILQRATSADSSGSGGTVAPAAGA
jgi:hypothetical protein